MSSSGLSRRRVGNANGDASDSPSAPSSSNGDPYPSAGAGHTRSNSDDHKIAYDPNEVAQDEEDKNSPKLTLMEEVLLLGLKDKQVGLSGFSARIRADGELDARMRQDCCHNQNYPWGK